MKMFLLRFWHTVILRNWNRITGVVTAIAMLCAAVFAGMISMPIITGKGFIYPTTGFYVFVWFTFAITLLSVIMMISGIFRHMIIVKKGTKNVKLVDTATQNQDELIAHDES